MTKLCDQVMLTPTSDERFLGKGFGHDLHEFADELHPHSRGTVTLSHNVDVSKDVVSCLDQDHTTEEVVI